MKSDEQTVAFDSAVTSVADGPVAGARIGRFVVEGGLGQGGMGIVLAARDPELHRPVAIKLLRPDLIATRPDSRDHLLREAQAMAMLAHPNVVAVYEVGRDGDQVFVAMERIDGGTLRAWLAAKRRPWREIVRMFVGAGRGLEAAHAAGLVHRDFKPENVLVGADGRPRVTDFGLTALGLGDGAIAGTPSYMSAEQWAGEVIDARSDQFSFCVALWDAIYGVRPFAGKDGPELSARVRAGELSPPPRDAGVPAWLEAALRRGLAVDPRARWPDLGALLHELERRAAPRGARWVALIAAAVAAPVAAAVVLVATRDAASDPCPAPRARLEAAWSAPRADQLRAHLVTIDAEHGADRHAVAAEGFEAGGAGWIDEHLAACRATRVEGRASGETLDARMRCLDRWLADLDVHATRFEATADLPSIDAAIDGIAGMSTPASCRDAAATPQPSGEAARAEAAAITLALEALDERSRAGDLAEVPADSEALLARARALDHPPTLAATLHAVIELREQVEGSVQPLLEELTRVAAIAGDDARAAYAWVRLVMVRGADLDQPARAEATYASADAAVLRIGDPASVRFDLNLARAAGLNDAGDQAGATVLLDDAARRIAAAAPADLPHTPATYRARLAFARGNVRKHAGDLAGAIAAYREALAARIEVLGPDHPELARIHGNIGEAFRKLDRVDEARQAFTDAARVVEHRIGETPLLAVVLNRLAWTWWVQDRADRALPYYERAVAIAEATMPPEHPNLAALHTDRGSALDELGRLDEAEAAFSHAIDLHARAKRSGDNVATAYLNRATVRTKQARAALAIADARQALQDVTAEDPGLQLMIRIRLGHLLLEHGDAADALPVLDAAVALEVKGLHADRKPLADLMRLRARIALGINPARWLRNVRRQRAALPPGVEPEMVADLDAWLARQR